MSGIWHQAGCCCNQAPCACPCDSDEWDALADSGTECHGLVQTYNLVGYSDYDLDECADCVDNASTAWDGEFKVSPTAIDWDSTGPPSCVWMGYPWYSIGSRSISGKHFHNFDHHEYYKSTRLWLNTAQCYWEMKIICDEYPGAWFDIWHGKKETGSTPVGTYSRIAGCDDTSTLEIEET
jgi:hypothetical protein